jgi:hypothetical protein
MPGEAQPSGSSRFDKVLEQYCVTSAGTEPEDLVVPCRSVVVLSGSPRHNSHRRPAVLRTTDLDELKRWIGVPDAAVKGRCLLDRQHRRDLAALRSQAKETAATTVQKAPPAGGVQLDTLRAHARAYLYGDSSVVADAKPLLVSHFEQFAVFAWWLRKVKVSSGSVLAFGPGANVLLAGEVEIEEGGQIISQGSLTVRVGTLRKTIPLTPVAAMPAEHAFAFMRA